MAGFRKEFFEGGEAREMSNAQFDTFLETLAKLIEAQAATIAEAAEIVRSAKTTA